MWNMLVKPRLMSDELKVWRAINSRMKLSSKESAYYLNLEKGYYGEKMFDEWIGDLTNEWLVLNDLQLEYNNTFFQIDSLIISSEKIYLFEVKNYEGDFIYDNERFYTKTKTEIKNPLLQLKRCESLFRRLLQDLGITYPIESHLIFINPEFHLYQSPLDLPIISPTQLNRFKNYLNSNTLRVETKHSNLANKLLSIHLSKSPFIRLPQYKYDLLNKGITCRDCFSITKLIDGKIVCTECGCKETIATGVLRNIKEFALLFPERKLTTDSIFEWCKVAKSKKIIRHILSKNYTLIGHGKSSCYIKNNIP
jgi:Nuclease-related domain